MSDVKSSDQIKKECEDLVNIVFSKVSKFQPDDVEFASYLGEHVHNDYRHYLRNEGLHRTMKLKVHHMIHTWKSAQTDQQNFPDHFISIVSKHPETCNELLTALRQRFGKVSVVESKDDTTKKMADESDGSKSQEDGQGIATVVKQEYQKVWQFTGKQLFEKQGDIKRCGSLFQSTIDRVLELCKKEEPKGRAPNTLSPDYVNDCLLVEEYSLKTYQKSSKFQNDEMVGFVIYAIMEQAVTVSIDIKALRSTMGGKDIGALLERKLQPEEMIKAEGCGTAILNDFANHIRYLLAQQKDGKAKYQKGEIILESVPDAVVFYTKNGFKPYVNPKASPNLFPMKKEFSCLE